MAVALVITWSFIGTGLVAWRHRPESRTGPLMVAVGFAWVLNALSSSTQPRIFITGEIISNVWVVLLFQLLLTFPDGRIRTPTERLLLTGAWVSGLALQIPPLLFQVFPDPDDLRRLPREPDPDQRRPRARRRPADRAAAGCGAGGDRPAGASGPSLAGRPEGPARGVRTAALGRWDHARSARPPVGQQRRAAGPRRRRLDLRPAADPVPRRPVRVPRRPAAHPPLPRGSRHAAARRPARAAAPRRHAPRSARRRARRSLPAAGLLASRGVTICRPDWPPCGSRDLPPRAGSQPSSNATAGGSAFCFAIRRLPISPGSSTRSGPRRRWPSRTSASRQPAGQGRGAAGIARADRPRG